MTNNDFLREDYSIDTPESVTLGYEVAGIGSRFIAALVDTTILAVALGVTSVLLVVLLSITGDLDTLAQGRDLLAGKTSWAGGLVIAGYALLNFLLLWGYYVLFELRNNGQTPGKSVAKIRVVRSDGNPANFLEIMVRNLVRIVDFLPSGYALGLVVMFFNRQARRLGDFAAGTLVIKAAGEVTLESLTGPQPPHSVGSRTRGFVPPRVAVESRTPAAPPTDESPSSAPAAPLSVGRLTAEDYALVRDVLMRDATRRLDDTLLRRLADALAAKIGRVEPVEQSPREFLAAVAAAYRRARG